MAKGLDETSLLDNVPLLVHTGLVERSNQNPEVPVHGFIKKTQKTPADDLALAKRRMKEVTK